MPAKLKLSNDQKCIGCGHLLRYDKGQKTSITSVKAEQYSQLLDKNVTTSDILCSTCYRALRSRAQSVEIEPEQSSSGANSNEFSMEDSKPMNFEPMDSESDVTLSQSFVESEPMDYQSSHSDVQSMDSQSMHAQDVQQSQSSQQTITSSSSCDSSQNDPTYVARIREVEEREMVQMPFSRTISSHKYCCVCFCKDQPLVVVPFEARLEVFVTCRLFVPEGNRCCAKHLIRKRFYKENIYNLQVFSYTSLIEKQELIFILNKLSDQSKSSLLDKVNNDLSDEQIQIFTGYSREQILKIKEMLISMRDSANRSTLQALFVFLFKLRSGNSNNLIASILDIKHEQNVSEYCQSVLTSFEKDILPRKLGVNACSREELIRNHTSPYVRELHGYENRLVLICDGSYLRHEKSSNNYYQRKSYSGQKKQHLCKPFTVCTTDGYIVDTFGPYIGTLNDAQILKTILSDPNGLIKLLSEGDVFILDRGFRDVVTYLEEKGFVVLMPALKGNRKQLTNEEANFSRFVTKLRWVVEAVHGIIGTKFKLLHNQLDNKLLPSVTLYCKCISFLINEFGKRLYADVNIQNEISEYMVSRKCVENLLAKEVEEGNWNRKRIIFKPLTSADVEDFPEMTERELKILFTGTYQLSQSVSYLAEIMSEDGTINIQYFKEDRNVLKCEIRSRHINNKIYKCYVHYEPHATDYRGIKQYVCDCANGLRTVGCCSHVAALIYYLSHARYLAEIVRPAKILTKIFEAKQIEPIIDEDSDED